MIALKHCDKILYSWLLALTGGESTLSNAEFSEAAASNMCLPSPSYMDRVGEAIKGRSKVDLYGDNVQTASLPGDHWHKRHDKLKFTIYRLCQWAGPPCEM